MRNYGVYNNWRCLTEETIFDALKSGISASRFPADSTVDAFDRVPGPGNPYPDDKNIVGQITVRPNEAFWVRVPA